MATKWRLREIESEKTELRNELAAKFPVGSDPSEMLKYLVDLVLSPTDDAMRFTIRHFVLIMKALIQHKESGGLTDIQVSRLAKLATQILQSAEVLPEGTRLSYLYGEIEMVLSQIDRAAGRHWSAMWRSSIASLHMSEGYPGGEAFRYLTIATREMRLGEFSAALQNLVIAESLSDENSMQWILIRLNRIKNLRMIGSDEFSALCDQTESVLMANPELLDKHAEELRWERLIRQCMRDNSFNKMFDLCATKDNSVGVTYLVEASMWWRIFHFGRDRFGLNKMSYLLRKNQTECRALGVFFDLALGLESLDDDTVPIVLRMKKLGELSEMAHLQVSIDKEILFLVAAARWLDHNKLPDAALHFWREYNSLSVRITSGHSNNCLAIQRTEDNQEIPIAS